MDYYAAIKKNKADYVHKMKKISKHKSKKQAEEHHTGSLYILDRQSQV